MSLEKVLEIKVEEVLKTSTVQKAGEVIRSRSGTSVLAAISFLESALPLPILTDPFLIAAVLVDRTRVVRLVVVTTISSVIGGICAYFTALYFFDALIGFLSPAVVEEFHAVANSNDSSTLLLTLIGAVTPVPYTIVAWVVAVLEGGLLTFIVASTLGRGFRYVVVGYGAYRFGPAAVAFARRSIGLTSIIVLLAAALFLWYKM